MGKGRSNSPTVRFQPRVVKDNNDRLLVIYDAYLRHLKQNSLYLERSEVSPFWLQSLLQASSTLPSEIVKEQAGHQWMNTWIKATCEELLSSDMDITHDFCDPADPVESSCKWNRRIKLQLYLQSSPRVFPASQYLVLKAYINCSYVPKSMFKVLNISIF